MNRPLKFQKLTAPEIRSKLKHEWLKTLTSPQDGMWNTLRDRAEQWGILADGETVGYACVDEEDRLIQFFVLPMQLTNGVDVLRQFLDERELSKGIVGTNNPVFLSLALHLTREVDIHTYLFHHAIRIAIDPREGNFRATEPNDLVPIVKAVHQGTGAPVEWLNGYLGDLIKKREIFFLEQDGHIVGTCEVRKNATSPRYADIGMVVVPAHRRQGYGTYLLGKAKEMAFARELNPICSCEKTNTASRKAIENCGFVSNHQLLAMDFSKISDKSSNP